MRPIDADEMALNESEAYMSAQLKVDDITAAVNSAVHQKIQQLIADTPTIDPGDLRPHGRWLEIPNAYVSVASKDDSYHGCATSCSVCGEINPNAYKTNYCPNCGAKMDEEDKK